MLSAPCIHVAPPPTPPHPTHSFPPKQTAGTLAKAADVLVANGARRVYSFASHGLFSGPANERIFKSKLEEVVVLNTIPLTPAHEANAKIVQLSVAPLIAQAIYNIHQKKSISALFK